MTGDVSDRSYNKVSWRLVPFLLVCYVFNYIDRINIGIAQLQFKQDLGFSDAVYGLGAGLFFVGFLLFEVPSNLLLVRVGARKTLFRIMILWGLVSAGTMFVRTPAEFYTARLLLGAAEAGFFPGVILYLTYWYPTERRARITSRFLLALPIAGMVGSPVSGFLMSALEGVLSYRGWQWLLLVEGLPSVALGILAYFYLDDGPATASWLTADEKNHIVETLAAEASRKGGSRGHGFAHALRDPRVYIAGAVSFASYSLASTIVFWSPSVIQSAGVADVRSVGMLSAIPFLVGALAMLVVSSHSDRTLERRWHAAVSLAVAASSVSMLPWFSGSPAISVALLALTSAGHYAALAVFWTIPSDYLSRSAAAGGIAMVSTIGALGGAIAPILLGSVKTMTGSLHYGLYVIAGMAALGSIILLVGIPAPTADVRGRVDSV